MNPVVRALPHRHSTRSIRRPVAAFTLAAGSLIGALALAGCGSGQISQTANQSAAVNGSHATVHNVALRDVHIRALQTGDALAPGTTVDLVLVATNQSPDVVDKLVAITSDIGPVTLTGDTRLPAGGSLFVSAAAGQLVQALDAVESADAAAATVALNRPISNGLTYTFTFDFEKAGPISLSVPISAGSPSPRDDGPGLAKHR